MIPVCKTDTYAYSILILILGGTTSTCTLVEVRLEQRVVHYSKGSLVVVFEQVARVSTRSSSSTFDWSKPRLDSVPKNDATLYERRSTLTYSFSEPS